MFQCPKQSEMLQIRMMIVDMDYKCYHEVEFLLSLFSLV